MHLRPFRLTDLEPLLDLTIATFGSFCEGSFRSLMGEVIARNEYATWREDYREMWSGLHDPENNKHVTVAENGGRPCGFVAWQADPARRRGEVVIIAVAPDQRRHHIGTALCAGAFDAMRQAGVEVVSLGTGGDPFHQPARALYESVGMIGLPLVRYYKTL